MAAVKVPDSVFFENISQLGERLRAKEFTAVDLTRAFLDRMETLGPRYNALVLLLQKHAVSAAKDIAGDMKRERFRSPLHGISFGAKDLLAFGKYPTTWGAKPYATQVLDTTATTLKKIDKAGGVLTAKLAMVELAGGPSYRYASASATGPGLNPWDPTRWSGGSSSGSAISVAAGLVTYALGSETSGSILTPSAFCGVTGLRPTYGLVSRAGAMALSWSLDKIGPICHTADDCGHVLQAMAGSDEADPASAGKSFYYAPQYARDLKEVKAGFAAIDFEEWAEPAARPDFAKALDTIRSLGLQVGPAKLPDFPFGPILSTILYAEASAVFEKLITSGRVDELTDARQIAGLRAGLDVPARDYLKAMRIRSLVQQGFRDLFEGVDVLVTPSRLGPAPKITQALDRPLYPERPRPSDRGLTRHIPAGNLAGLPALSLPCGFADGMPIAVSVVGPPFSENLLLTIGREFQKKTDWHLRKPEIA